jgi:hypothetical protein
VILILFDVVEFKVDWLLLSKVIITPFVLQRIALLAFSVSVIILDISPPHFSVEVAQNKEAPKYSGEPPIVRNLPPVVPLWAVVVRRGIIGRREG